MCSLSGGGLEKIIDKKRKKKYQFIEIQSANKNYHYFKFVHVYETYKE